MPQAGNDTNYMSFEQQGADMLVTVYNQRTADRQYTHATHRLDPAAVQMLRDECEKCLAAKT